MIDSNAGRNILRLGVGLVISLWAFSAQGQGGGLAALTQSDVEGPVIVVDLVKFKPGGEEHYDTYDAMGEVKLKDLGGEIIFRGRRTPVAALDSRRRDSENQPAEGAQLNSTQWDRVTIRRYPTKEAVLALGASAEYRAALRYRIEGVEASFVYAFSGELPSLDGAPNKGRHPMGAVEPLTSDAVYMLNLLRFKKDGGERKFFTKYGAPRGGFRPVPVLMAKGITPIIGQVVVDRLILARYPSAKAFSEMIASAEYRAVSHHRTEAIELGLIWPFSMK